MFIARAQSLTFVGSPDKISHRMWEAAEKLVEADNNNMGILATGNMPYVISETYDGASDMLKKMVGKALAEHFQGFNPEDFRFCVSYSDVKSGTFWIPNTSHDGGHTVPEYTKPKD